MGHRALCLPDNVLYLSGHSYPSSVAPADPHKQLAHSPLCSAHERFMVGFSFQASALPKTFMGGPSEVAQAQWSRDSPVAMLQMEIISQAC